MKLLRLDKNADERRRYRANGSQPIADLALRLQAGYVSLIDAYALVVSFLRIPDVSQHSQYHVNLGVNSGYRCSLIAILR